MGNTFSIDQFRAATNKAAKTAETTTDNSKFSAAEPARNPTSVPLVNPGMRASIVAQCCVFGKTCGQVARQMGLERHNVESVLIQELSKRCAEEYRRGYEAGRRPSPPASALRPTLRKVA